MHPLAALMAERIASGLKRKSLNTCSRWTESCRIMGKPFPGPWSFKHHPWLRGMHDSVAEMNVGQKSAQMGYTETALNVTFFNIDVKSVDCLYVLPAQTPDASDFSAARFDPALEMSSHLSKLFSDVQNVGHKRAGPTNLYIRGSKSRSGLKSIPVGLIVLDEVDEMEEANIPLALERAAGQVEKMVWALSTPTIPNHGINKLYRDTTKEHFFFPCPSCSRKIELKFPDNLIITAEDVNDPQLNDSHLICTYCKNKLQHETKYVYLQPGIWVPEHTDRPARGFHINQMYSSTVTPATIAKSYLKSLRDPSEEQEFWNSKMGLDHVVEGTGVTDKDLDACLCNDRMQSYATDSNRIITMGIDVGKWIHFEVDEWHLPGNIQSTSINDLAVSKVIKMGKVLNFEELDALLSQYAVKSCVIDANPERRKAMELASRNPGRVRLCFYGQGITGKATHIGKDVYEPTVTVDRTAWLDLSLGRFRRVGAISIPIDTTQEYRSHMKALIRVYEKNKEGNPVGRYIKAENQDDHYAHARNYAEIALPFALSLGTSQDIDDDY